MTKKKSINITNLHTLVGIYCTYSKYVICRDTWKLGELLKKAHAS